MLVFLKRQILFTLLHLDKLLIYTKVISHSSTFISFKNDRKILIEQYLLISTEFIQKIKFQLFDLHNERLTVVKLILKLFIISEIMEREITSKGTLTF